MKVSLKWLRSLVDIEDISAEEIADKLTFAGVEVSSIEHMAEGTNLVIGLITSSIPHPNSDHLHILTVNEGEKYGIHQIVCGAPNVKEGLKVIVAREGAKLPGGIINRGVIRGIESDGMCCSLAELGVDKKYLSEYQLSGIEELPEDAPIGEENVLGYLGLDDEILVLELLANRSDLLAMENVAREVAALFSRPLHLGRTPIIKTSPSDFLISSETEKCPIFEALIVKGVKTLPSPIWLKQRLEASGVRSINNVVDIGNYVMLLTGQPLNMYDLDKLPKESLIVKDKQEEYWVAMDEKKYKIESGDICVTSGPRTMCLAGIMTSEECAVDEHTENILIEAALFYGPSIRRTSSRLGLASESSSRFVKGINPHEQERVLAVTASLCETLCGANRIEKPKPYIEYDKGDKKISTSLSYINKRLGTSFDKEEVIDALRRLHFSVRDGKDDTFSVTVPHYRLDVSGEEDISEEVIRLLGFDKVPSSLPIPAIQGLGYSEKQKNKRAIRRHLSSLGLDECISYSLVSRDYRGEFPQLGLTYNRRLLNPLTEDRAFLRKSLLPSLLLIAQYNASRQNKDLALFEISDLSDESSSRCHLAVVLCGEKKRRDAVERKAYDFYSAKGLFYSVASLLGLNANRFVMKPLSDAKEDFHPYRSAEVTFGKDRVAVFGELHPSACDRYDIPPHSVALEMDLTDLLTARGGSVKASIPPKFPMVSRDLSFVIDKGAVFGEIERSLKRLDKRIETVKVFDIYAINNDVNNRNKLSMAINLHLRDENKTLVDEEVKEIMEKVMVALKTEFGAEVRGNEHAN